MDWLGLIAGLIAADWWSLFTTLVGAVIGAAVSYVIARQTAQETREAQRLERLDQEKGAAYALTVKLMRLLNSLSGYHTLTEASISEADKQIPDSPLWAKMVPLLASDESFIRVDPSEWAILVAAKEVDLLSRAIMLTDRYNALVHGYQTYSAERVRLTDLIGGAEMQGKVGTTFMTQEEHNRVAPRSVTLEAHAKDVRERIEELLTEARDLVPKLGPVMRAHFKDPRFPILTLTDSNKK